MEFGYSSQHSVYNSYIDKNICWKTTTKVVQWEQRFAFGGGLPVMDDQSKFFFTDILDEGYSFETEDGIIVIGTKKRENNPLLENAL